MGHVYKWLGSDEQTKQLWQNEEALKKYIARLKEFWDEENQCWLASTEPPAPTAGPGASGLDSA